MGSPLSKIREPRRAEKRKSTDIEPGKKRYLSTREYIYRELFNKEKESDIKLIVRNNVWYLHKIYLCQSPYFLIMFNGTWQESCQDSIEIEIEDKRITHEALDAVFGSLYSSAIEIGTDNVINILATANFFQLNDIVEACEHILLENMDATTVILYYNISCKYSRLAVKNAAFQYLTKNLLANFVQHENISKISTEIMHDLVASAELYVVENEYSLYILLRTWMFLCLNPEFKLRELVLKDQEIWFNILAENNVIHDFFRKRSESELPFLATTDGQHFAKPFQALRLQYLTNHSIHLKTMLDDNIIPKEWLHIHVMEHWKLMLKMDHETEEGPQNLEPNIFYENCMRFGRIIRTDKPKMHWNNSALESDLILTSLAHIIMIRREQRHDLRRVQFHQKKFMMQLSVTSFNVSNHESIIQKSELLSLSLEENDEKLVMLLNKNIVYPLLVSVNLLLAVPKTESDDP